eukprot:5534310-Amphidinium_carterae.1
MALHKWNRDTDHSAVYTGQSISMRVGTPPDNTTGMQVRSSVTILHSSISMTVGNGNDNPIRALMDNGAQPQKRGAETIVNVYNFDLYGATGV